MNENQELRGMIAELSAQLQVLASAVAILKQDSAGDSEDFSQDDFWQDMVPAPGGGSGGDLTNLQLDGELNFYVENPTPSSGVLRPLPALELLGSLSKDGQVISNFRDTTLLDLRVNGNGEVIYDNSGDPPLGVVNTLKGNTLDSVKIKGDVEFVSAVDSNVEVKTLPGASDSDPSTVTIGVYYI